uniref:Uncharacterized protein n=1 Tax=Timema bartmani TaxID=61472 RepID=A0A7R9I0K3_9NEOP|nr:unnamed protein product [Timema bartmani]
MSLSVTIQGLNLDLTIKGLFDKHIVAIKDYSEDSDDSYADPLWEPKKNKNPTDDDNYDDLQASSKLNKGVPNEDDTLEEAGEHTDKKKELGEGKQLQISGKEI